MKHHGLRGWKFAYSLDRWSFGSTVHGTKTIYLSAPRVETNSQPIVEECILHEIAHALMPESAGHGRRWAALAKSIGCSATKEVPKNWINKIPRGHKTAVKCPTCGLQDELGAGYRGDKYKINLACQSCMKANGGVFSEKFRPVVAV